MCCSPRKLWFGGNFVSMAFLGLFLTSCHGSSYELDGYNRQRKRMDAQDYQQEYQKYQQSGGYLPQGGVAPAMSNGGAPVKVVPDYYYQQQGRQGYPAAPTQAQRRAAQPRPNASYPQSRMQYAPPNSRAYDNPYSFQSPMQYPYYDADSYYVPPAQYYDDDEMIDKERSPLGRQ